jgi:hypothetical protein
MKRIVLSLVLIGLFCNSFAQDYYTSIKTPTNVGVEVIYRVEYSTNDIAIIEAQAAGWIIAQNSNAVRVAPASRTYNCHNYAWHYSDGGTKRWINQFDQYGSANLLKYWSGSVPTYQIITASKASKAFYSDGDHSAKVISPVLFESKWGEWPRYQHAPSDCPYTSSNIKYYYVPVSGDDLICTSKVYSTLNITGANYNWSGSGVSFTEHSSSATAIKNTNYSSGWIISQVYSPFSGTTFTAGKKSILIGPQMPGPITIDFDVPPGRFTAMIDGVPTATSYKWYCDGKLNSSTGTIARFTRQTENCEHVYYVDVIAVNECGESGLRHAEVSEPPCNYYSIFPNPASTEITITQNTSKTASTQSSKKPIKEVRIIDKFGRQALTQSFGDEVYETKLNISNLQTGSYTIQINQGTEMETYTVIKE